MRKQLTTYRPVMSTLIMGLVATFLCVSLGKILFFDVFIPVVALVSVTLIICAVLLYSSHKRVESFVLALSEEISGAQPQILKNFPLPIITAKSDEIIWYNEISKLSLLESESVIGKDIKDILGGEKSHHDFFNIEYKNKYYTVYPVEKVIGGDTVSYYFVENTELKTKAKEYDASRLVIFAVSIDNYVELMKSNFEREMSQIFMQVEKKLEDYVKKFNGSIFKVDRDRYFLMIEERHMPLLLGEHFSILDDVRTLSINNDNLSVSLSIGVARNFDTITEGKKVAMQSLEMSQGRGGDQVALKTLNGYEFYGGVSKGVEKHTKVKTRIMANSIADQIEQSDVIFIMGHKIPDYDCFGAAVGLSHYTKTRQKKTYIVTSDTRNISQSLIDEIKSYDNDLIITPDYAMQLAINGCKNPLLLIVDTHIQNGLESQELLNGISRNIVIDHHRKAVKYIENSLVFYLEPYASSASEMVAELLQYFEDTPHLEVVESQALLAGIMLDTKNFVSKTGARTFEAASFLRKQGADTVATRKYFATTLEKYKEKAALIATAEYYKNSAIVVTDMKDGNIRLIAAQTADELLNVESIIASYVVYMVNENVCISARSNGDINVQVIMEKLGGGGHLTMAATQMKDISLEEAKQKLLNAISSITEG